MRYGYYDSKNRRLLDSEANVKPGFSDEELLEQVVQLLEEYDGELPSSRDIQHYRLTEASLGVLRDRLGGGKWQPVKDLALAEYLRRHPELEPAKEQALVRKQECAANSLCRAIVQDGGVIQPFVTYFDEYDFGEMDICQITEAIGRGSWTMTKQNIVKLLKRHQPGLELNDAFIAGQRHLDGEQLLHNLVVLAYKVDHLPNISDVDRNIDVVGLGARMTMRRVLGRKDGKWAEVRELIRAEISKVDGQSPVLTNEPPQGYHAVVHRRKNAPFFLPV